MEQPIQPIVPEGTPLPPAPVGVPPYPITPFAVWTWSSPVIPEFYWNVYSSEQRIKQICKEIGKIESYLNYLVNKTNENIIELHKRIDVLTERVAALEKHVEEEVARLDALIAQLRSDLEQEIADREQGDENLDRRITQEIHDRQDADEVLHGEISQEVQDRIHADDQLHEEISHRLLPTDIQAGDEISITRPDPNSNTIVIASTVAHSIEDLENTVSGLQAALTSETEERRADDASLWTAVNERIERGKILAGTGIKVVNDPDSSTVTISATGGGTGGGSTTVTGAAPVEVTGDPDEGYTVGVSAATEDAAGVITEARVKELASGPSLSAEEPLKLEDGTISVREITPDTESEDETGVVSKATIKSLATFSGGVAPNGGLYNRADLGGLGVKLGDIAYNNIGLNSDGELTLVGFASELHADTKTIATPTIDWTDEFWDGRPDFLQNTQSPNNGSNAAEFVLSSGVFEVQEVGSKTWEEAELGTFELVSIPDRLREDGAAKGFPDYHTLYARITPYGQSYYTPSITEVEGRVKIQGLRVHYAYYNIYVTPTGDAE